VHQPQPSSLRATLYARIHPILGKRDFRVELSRQVTTLETMRVDGTIGHKFRRSSISDIDKDFDLRSKVAILKLALDHKYAL